MVITRVTRVELGRQGGGSLLRLFRGGEGGQGSERLVESLAFLGDALLLPGEGTGLQYGGMHDDAAIPQVGQGMLGVAADADVGEGPQAVPGGTGPRAEWVRGIPASFREGLVLQRFGRAVGLGQPTEPMGPALSMAKRLSGVTTLQSAV